MPGIVGVVSRRPAYECEPLVRRMLASMLHESFYVTGTSQNANLGVYSGWVAHKGSFAAAECCKDEKDVSVSFAGECYSDSQKSVTDRYSDQGEAFIPQLNGLFGGLIIDRALGAAILFNDRYGIERLYVHESNGETYFASEAKALLGVLPKLRAFDEEGVEQYLAFGC